MVDIVINGTRVDTYENMPMSLNYSIADIRNPEKRNTSFSKTIKLPGSKTNDELFSFIFEISKEALSAGNTFDPDFNASKKASCIIYSRSLLQLNGFVQLLKIVVNEDYHEYEVCVFGKLADIITDLENVLLSDLDFSEYNHELNITNVVNSWSTSIIKNGSTYSNFTGGSGGGYENSYSAVTYVVGAVLKVLTGGTGILPVGSIIIVNDVPRIVKIREIIGGYIYIQISPGTGLPGGTAVTINVNPIPVVPGVPSGEGYVYPIIDYGYKLSLFGTQKINEQELIKMFPAIYLKTYLDKMFKISGKTYTSTFFQSNFFKRLIIPFDNNRQVASDATVLFYKVEREYTGDVVVENIPYSTPFDSIPYIERVLDFPSGITDPSLAWNNASKLIQVKKKGNYQLKFNYNILVEVGSPGVYAGYSIVARVRDSSGAIKRNYTVTGRSGTGSVSHVGTAIVPSISLLKNESVQFILRGYYKVTVRDNTSFEFKILAVPAVVGDTFVLNSVVPANVKCKDLFLSIIKMFNLYVAQDPNNENNLIIESYNDFYNGSVKDWTNKLDRSMPIEIMPVGEIDGKNYLYKYKDDKDYYNTNYTELQGEIYGNRKVTIDNDFIKGDKTIDVVFSQTPLIQDNASGMIVPSIVSIEDDGTKSPIVSNIRIMYYGGLRNISGRLKIYSGTTLYSYAYYPYCGHVDNPTSPNLDLCFEIPKALYYNTSIYTTANLYNMYWKQFIEEITDKDSKIVKAYFRLTAVDIFNLNFRCPVQIDGINYRINKILDYDPDNDEVCSVELSKVRQGVKFIPYSVDVDPVIFNHLIQGGVDEVRSSSATSYIQLIQGGLDEVQGAFSDSPIQIINGGTD